MSLFIAINISAIGFKLLDNLFEGYLLEVVIKDQTNINSELLALAQFAARAVLVLIVIFLFAQTHQINLIGLLASLGVAGAAIALASQKILEQILWSIVLYLDRPFNVGDYIHLSGGIIGQVETTGWRSTQVRLSGKNTLVIVPNSHLAQTNIENLTKARRVVLIVDLLFFRTMSDEEKALIRQLILDSTREILGIDSQLTQIMFQDEVDSSDQHYVRTQAIFFVLGSAETSMELRKSLLEIARANIIEKLHNYGIEFKFEEKIVDITQPMRI
ncbi:MAG: mechanosensitive ion channel family protein [Spirulina sp.]